MKPTNVAVLRQTYCNLVGDDVEPQLRADAPVPESGKFLSSWGDRFWLEITFGAPGLEDWQRFARLTAYIIPVGLKLPPDVYAICEAVDDSRDESGSVIRASLYHYKAGLSQCAAVVRRQACTVIGKVIGKAMGDAAAALAANASRVSA